tara:strand:- start:2315 stop:2809 length:495 start_codon:yes stop_codon:yes gene_type:complete
MINKRGQSQIVATVLLILLVIVAIMIVFTIVIPLVKDKLSSGDCLDVAGKIEISTGYTCFNTDKMQVQIGLGPINASIEGFVIELGGASTKSYEIKSGEIITDVDMCVSEDIELPEDNEERTYVFSNVAKPDVVRVYPILTGGRTCDASDVVTEISDCLILQQC